MLIYKGFFDSQQLNNYLSGSLIRMGEEPIYIVGASFIDNNTTVDDFLLKKCLIDYVDLQVHKQKRKEIILKDLNLTPVPLGYLTKEHSFKKGLYFATVVIDRLPKRVWKLGLSADNIYVQLIDTKFSYNEHDILVSFEMRKTVLGIYQTFKNANTIFSIKENYGVLPFHRFFALKKENGSQEVDLLHYRHLKEPVGSVYNGTIYLKDQFKYLNEALEEALDEQRKNLPDNS